MNKIVKASSRKIFGLFLGLAIISETVDMIAYVGIVPELVSDLLYVGVVTFMVGWILITGRSLEAKKYGTLTRAAYKIFFCIGILLIVTTSTGRLFSAVNQIISNETTRTIFTIYVFASIFWIATFTAKTLKANETTEEIDINDYFTDIFKIIFWPIGIWMIQPRVNRIFVSKDDVRKTYL